MLSFHRKKKNLYGWDYATVMNGADHLIKALKYYKSQNVDMIVFNGDVVNATGDYAAYSAYNKILDYVYGEDRAEAPHIIYPMGNHEILRRQPGTQIFTSQPVFLSTQERLLTAIALSPFLIQNLKKEMKNLPKATIHLQMEHIMRKE